MSPPLTVELADVRFAFGTPGAVDGFELEIDQLEIKAGERVACIGASGTGKTTLVNLIAGIHVPDSGRVHLAGMELTEAGEAARRAQRIARVGMVFQEFALLDYASALDNILLPYHLSAYLKLNAAVEQRAGRLAERLGISGLLRRRPNKLSQGERQRVALCRALLTEPALLLCDEATGNLDPETAKLAIDLLLEEAATHAAAVFLVTHDHSLLGRFDRVVEMDSVARIRRNGAEVIEAGGASK
ncbi:MAG: putative ABC transport system ATP-binding protein [Planctomycetota bacterium]